VFVRIAIDGVGVGVEIVKIKKLSGCTISSIFEGDEKCEYSISKHKNEIMNKLLTAFII
jgi:NADPH-dependent curcumin reductase CurA